MQVFLWSHSEGNGSRWLLFIELCGDPSWQALTEVARNPFRVPAVAQGLGTQHSVFEDVGSIPGLPWWVTDPELPQAAVEVADVAQDPVWLWLWYRMATAAPTQPLAWEIPYVVRAALKKKKKCHSVS